MMGISESADQMPSANIDRFKPLPFFQHYGREIGLPVIVVALIVVFTANSEVFFSVANFRNIGVSAAALAAVSFGQTFAILTAGLDLSVGSIVALVSIVGAIVMRDLGMPAGLIASLVTGAGVGLVNGIVITRFKVFPFIATLAMMSIISGLALSLSGGVAVTGVPGAFADLAYELVLGVPVPVIIALLVLLTAFVVLKYTRLGRRIYAVGGNEEAARLSGIRIGAIKTAAYVSSGVIGVAFGVLFVSILSNGLNLLNVPSYTQMMVIGGALILAVALDQAFIESRIGKKA
jgi:ribose transport system permease protein